GGGMPEVFGFASAQPSERRSRLIFRHHPLTQEFLELPEETAIRLTGEGERQKPIGSLSFDQPKAPPLAVYDDGGTAITQFAYNYGVQYVEMLNSLSMEIGSHTVAHSKVFKQMPLGDGNEQYPDYQPFVTGESTVRNATILGELRVSKFLLEYFSN